MQDTESILATHSINNPTDAALVRLAAVAVAQPDVPVEELLKRTSFAHPGDAALARAIVESVRANPPPAPVGSRKPVFVAAALGAITLSLAGWVVVATNALSTERAAQADQVQRFTKQIADLQAASGAKLGEIQQATTAALRKSEESAVLFNTTMGQHSSQIASLTGENEKLKAENERLKAELVAAKAKGN